MAVPIPQVITPSKASGAQVIDGSLKFDRSVGNFLYRVFSTEGNRRTWTWAGWLKPSPDGNYKRFWGVGGDTSPSVSQNYYRHNNTGTLTIGSDTDSTHKITSQNLRDTGWYHVVIIQDTTDATAADRFRLYLNGERVTSFGTDNNFSQNAESTINNNTADGNYHALGCTIANGNLASPTEPFDGAMSQVYFIDGQALEPENFGFTDPLTNTWKPKNFFGAPDSVLKESIKETGTITNVATLETSYTATPSNRARSLGLAFTGAIHQDRGHEVLQSTNSGMLTGTFDPPVSGSSWTAYSTGTATSNAVKIWFIDADGNETLVFNSTGPGETGPGSTVPLVISGTHNDVHGFKFQMQGGVQDTVCCGFIVDGKTLLTGERIGETL